MFFIVKLLLTLTDWYKNSFKMRENWHYVSINEFFCPFEPVSFGEKYHLICVLAF